MVSALIWDASLQSLTTIMTTALDSLGATTISAASTEVDNTTNLHTAFWLELFTDTLAGTPTVDTTIDLYMTRQIDGTNYETAPVTGGAQAQSKYLGSVFHAAATTARRTILGPFPMDPIKYKFYVDNRLSAALAATANTLKIGSRSLEGQ